MKRCIAGVGGEPMTTVVGDNVYVCHGDTGTCSLANENFFGESGDEEAFRFNTNECDLSTVTSAGMTAAIIEGKTEANAVGSTPLGIMKCVYKRIYESHPCRRCVCKVMLHYGVSCRRPIPGPEPFLG